MICLVAASTLVLLAGTDERRDTYGKIGGAVAIVAGNVLHINQPCYNNKKSRIRHFDEISSLRVMTGQTAVEPNNLLHTAPLFYIGIMVAPKFLPNVFLLGLWL